MPRIYVLFGMTGAGKSTIASLVSSSMGMGRLLTTTTRPKRNEADNEYHFVTDEYFLSHMDDFVAVRKYTALLEGFPKDYYYGVSKADLEKGGILITDFVGLTELFERGYDMTGIYLHVDAHTRRQRAKNRPGFNLAEYERRDADDMLKFPLDGIISLGTKYPIHAITNGGGRTVNEVAEDVEMVMEQYGEMKKGQC